jgi:hypothetical protein
VPLHQFPLSSKKTNQKNQLLLPSPCPSPPKLKGKPTTLSHWLSRFSFLDLIPLQKKSISSFSYTSSSLHEGESYLSELLVFNGCNVDETEPRLKPDRAPIRLESAGKPFSKTILKTLPNFLKTKKRERFLSKSKGWTILVTIALRLIDMMMHPPFRAGGGQKQVFDADQEGLTKPLLLVFRNFP